MTGPFFDLNLPPPFVTVMIFSDFDTPFLDGFPSRRFSVTLTFAITSTFRAQIHITHAQYVTLLVHILVHTYNFILLVCDIDVVRLRCMFILNEIPTSHPAAKHDSWQSSE